MVAAAVTFGPLKSTVHTTSPDEAIVPADAKAVAVDAFPVTSPVSGPANASEVTVPSNHPSLNS